MYMSFNIKRHIDTRVIFRWHIYIFIYIYVHKLRIRNSKIQNQNAREQERPEVTHTKQESVWALALKYGSYGQPGFAWCTPDAQERGENRSVSKTEHVTILLFSHKKVSLIVNIKVNKRINLIRDHVTYVYTSTICIYMYICMYVCMCICIHVNVCHHYSRVPGQRNHWNDPASEFLSAHWWSQHPACQRCFYQPLKNCHPSQRIWGSR